MPAEGRGPDLRQAGKVTRPRRLADGLATPLERVQTLQTSLQAKAKAEPALSIRSESWEGCGKSGVPTKVGRSPAAFRLARHSRQGGIGYCQIPGRVSLRDSRPLRLAAAPGRPAECEGLMTQVKAG